MPIDLWINAGTLVGVRSADAESWGAMDNDFMAGLRNSLDYRVFLADIHKWNERLRCGPLDESDRNQGKLMKLVTHNGDEGTFYYGTDLRLIIIKIEMEIIIRKRMRITMFLRIESQQCHSKTK